MPLLFLPILARSLPDAMGSMMARKDYKRVREVLIEVNPLYKPTESEHIYMNDPNQSDFTSQITFC